MNTTLEQAKEATRQIAKSITGLKGVVIETETSVHVIRCEKPKTVKK